MAMIKIEKEEYKKVTTTIDSNALMNHFTIKLPFLDKIKFFKRVNKVKTKDGKAKEIIQEVEL